MLGYLHCRARCLSGKRRSPLPMFHYSSLHADAAAIASELCIDSHPSGYPCQFARTELWREERRTPSLPVGPVLGQLAHHQRPPHPAAFFAIPTCPSMWCLQACCRTSGRATAGRSVATGGIRSFHHPPTVSWLRNASRHPVSPLWGRAARSGAYVRGPSGLCLVNGLRVPTSNNSKESSRARRRF